MRRREISVNSPALGDPELIDALSQRFGAQCVVVGVDSQTFDQGYRVQQFTGDIERTRDTSRSTVDWVIEAQRRGAGEIVLNCMSSDGVRRGFDIAQTARNTRGVPRAAGCLGLAPGRRNILPRFSKPPKWMRHSPQACFIRAKSRFQS